MILNIQKLQEDVILPTYGSIYAAGLDLYSNQTIEILPQSRTLVSTGISISWDNYNYYMRIAPRSGLSVKYNIDIGAGVVDYDYRGEIFVCFINNDCNKSYTIQKGDRIAQMIPTKIERCTIINEVLSHEKTERGENGFGSTGK